MTVKTVGFGELGVTNVPVITVFNKIDRVDNLQIQLSLRSRYPDSITISSAQGTGLDILREALKKAAMAGQITLTLDFGSDESALLREIYRHAVIRKTEEHGEIIRLTFTLPVSLARKFHLYDILSAKLEKS